MSGLTAKTCIKCGRTIDNNKDIAYEVVNHNWVRLGYVCDDCVDTYPAEDIKDPDVEGDKIIPKDNNITAEEVRLSKVEEAVLALCDLIINCSSDEHYYCGTRRCKDDKDGLGCPFAVMVDYRDNMQKIKEAWRGNR